MGATRAFSFTRQAHTIEAVPRSAARRWRKNMAARTVKRANVENPPKSAASDEEWEIVQRAIAGDSEPLAALFACKKPRLYRTAFAVLRNKEDAEDALQIGYMSAYANLASFAGRSKFSTWLTRIVLNAALMHRRKLRVFPQLSLDETVAGNPAPWADRLVDPHPDPEQVCAQTETRDIVNRELNQLSPLLRSTFQLRFIADFSAPEAAELQSLNLSAAKSRASRARQQVARLLSARGVDPRCAKLQSAGRLSAAT
jgi:RNA polymerase sigma-70 factor (ECF subfamily)